MQGERRPGTVGVPLPGVQIKVSSSSTAESSTNSSPGTTNRSSTASTGSSSNDTDADGSSKPDPSCSSSSSSSQSVTGELLVRGDMLFREYWGRPEATAEAFDDEGYFKTGDVVELQGDPPYYRVSIS